MRITHDTLKSNGVLGVYDTRRECFWKFEILTGFFWNLVPDYQGESLQKTKQAAKCIEYVLLESKSNLLKDNRMLLVVDKRKENKCRL
ncbi:MAG: hypothetical protein IKZ88_06195 [Neisseriaceae bacterium]|nr:hypothetical protein [Neisseriaceae bacterium]